MNAGHEQAFADLMKSIAPETRAFEGCSAFDVRVDTDAPERVVLNELRDNREGHQAYLAWRGETGVLDTLVAFLREPPTPRYFDIVDT